MPPRPNHGVTPPVVCLAADKPEGGHSWAGREGTTRRQGPQRQITSYADLHMNPYADKSTMTAEVYAGVHDVVVEILEAVAGAAAGLDQQVDRLGGSLDTLGRRHDHHGLATDRVGEVAERVTELHGTTGVPTRGPGHIAEGKSGTAWRRTPRTVVRIVRAPLTGVGAEPTMQRWTSCRATLRRGRMYSAQI
jgi:hypothetical protein